MQLGKRAAALLLALFLLAGNALSPVTAYALDTGQETVTAETTAQTQSTGTGTEEPTETLPETSLNETEVTEAASEPPASSEATDPTDAPAETTEATAPVNTTEATEPLETTEATVPVNTTQATEPSTETEPETVNTLTGYLASRAASVTVTVSEGNGVPKDSVLTVTGADPDGSTMQAIIEKLNIGAVLDYCVFDMGIGDASISGSVSVDIVFQDPSVMATDSESVYVAEVKADGTLNLIGNADAVVNADKRVESIRFTLSGFSDSSTFVILTSDWPNVTAFQTYPEYTVRATYGAISGIGDSQGGLTYHCWKASSTPSASKPAICLDSNRLFGSGDNTFSYGLANSTYTAEDDNSKTQSWKSLSEGTRELLVLLCCYGLSDWSPSSRYIDDINSGNTFAAMQLVAWEWINGKSDGTYTSHYNSTVQDIADNLRYLCYNNPDNVDTTKSYVYIIWPNSQKIYNGRYVWGQELIALHTVEYAQSTGSLTVTKAVTGTGSKANWRMELYTSQSAANSAAGYTAYAYTNSSGVATFSDLAAGTYYVREAPASRQDKVTTTGWTLSTAVLSGTVTSGNTTSAGTVTNISPAILSVKKAITPSSLATSANLQNWRFELYSTQSAAAAGGTNYVAYAYTNTSGVATFYNLTANTTYYVREAPASRQDKVTTTGWMLSTTVLSKAGTGGATSATSMGTITNTYGKYIRLVKAASDPDCYEQIKDNAMYSLAGAEYQITASNGTTETVVTGADGAVISANLYNVGTTGTIRETKAPNGFLLDSTVYTWEILADSSEYCVVNVTDKPIFDPPFAITKVDQDTTTAQGNSSFSGAVFKWEYFDNTDWSGTPKRTWYFQTNANGRAEYNPSFLASNYTSNDLYVDSSGAYQVPLGTVKITEVENSLGYIVIQQPLYCSIVQNTESSFGADFVWTPESWNIIVDMASGNYGVYEPVDPETFGSLSIQKLDKDSGTVAPTWASFAGCEFTVYNRSNGPVKVGDYTVAQPGEVCYTLTADEAGKASTGRIFPIGTYEVRETKGNDYYQCNADWSFTFTITGTEANPAYAAECANTMHPATINLQKASTDGQPLPGARFALEWSEDGTTWKPVTKSDDIVMGGCSSPELDEKGCLTIGEDGTASFTGLYPVVYYRITEVETPNGYQLLKDPIFVDKLLPEDNFEISYRVVNNDVFTLPKTGGFGFWMILPAFGLASAALFFGIFASTKKREAHSHAVTNTDPASRTSGGSGTCTCSRGATK